MAYNRQPPHQLTTTDTIGITNANIEVSNTRIDRVSHYSSKWTKFSLISVKNESQKFSTRRKARLIKNFFTSYYNVLPKKIHTCMSQRRLAVLGSWIKRIYLVPSNLNKCWASHSIWRASKGSVQRSMAQSHSERDQKSKFCVSFLYLTDIRCFSGYNNLSEN